MVLPPKKTISKKNRILLSMTAAAFCWAIGTPKVFATSPWTEREASPANADWLTLRSSSTGDKLVGIIYSHTDSLKHVEYSLDAGITWTDITPNDPDVDDGEESNPVSIDRHVWSSVAISSDGNTVALTDNNTDSEHNYVWYTTNHGGVWNKLTGVGQPGAGYWDSITLGNNGQDVAVSSISGENIAVSVDGGTTWNLHTEPTVQAWGQVAFSPDGGTLATFEDGGGYIFVSGDQGATWDVQSAPNSIWTHISVADNGNMIASASNRPVYVRKMIDEEFVWQNIELGTNTNVAISGDGSTLVRSEEPGYIYSSTIDNPTVWLDLDYGGQPSTHTWTGLAINNDGGKIFAGGSLTNIWAYDAALADHIPPTVISVSPSGGSIDAGAATTTPIVIQFSEPTGLVSLDTSPCESTCATYDESYSDDYTQLTLTRNDQPFAYGTEYTLTLMGVDEGNNEMVEPYVWSFYTNKDTSVIVSPPRMVSGTTLQHRVKNLEAMGNQTLANELKQEQLNISNATTTLSSNNVPVVVNSGIDKVTKNLFFGMTGSEITMLQNFLISQYKGPASLALKVHGTSNFFGKLTRAALVEWQSANNIIPSTGNFGPKTRAMIKTLGA